MTIRKSTTNNGELPVTGQPYPLSPASAPQHSLPNSGIGSPGTETTPWRSDREAQNLGLEIDEATGRDIPPSLRIGEDVSRTNAAANPDTLPAALQVRPAEVTPRSSVESQRSKGSSSPCPAPNNVSGDRSTRTKLASNNPFLRQMSNPACVPTNPAGEQSSARIWAERPEDQTWYSQNGPSAIPQTLDQPSNSRLPRSDSQTVTSHSAFPETISSLRPMKDAPFEDPWNDPTASPSLQAHIDPIDSGLKAGSNTFAGSTDSTQGTQYNAVNGGPISEPSNSLENEKNLPPLPQRGPDDVATGLPPQRTDHIEEHPPPQPAPPEVDTPFTAGAVDARAQAELDKRKKQRSETYQIRKHKSSKKPDHGPECQWAVSVAGSSQRTHTFDTIGS